MSNFFVIFIFFLFFGLPVAFLFNEPDKKCVELIKSSRYTELSKKLQGKFPIEKSAYHNVKIWDENGVVNYSELLSAMKGLMTKVKSHQETNKQIPRYDDSEECVDSKATIQNRNAADHFIHSSHKDFVKILKENCGKNKFGILNVNVEQVLNEVLECAVEVHEYIKENYYYYDKTGEKVAKVGKWNTVDNKFEKALKTIWVLYEPVQLYAECHEFSESSKFNEMISILQKKIPIKNGENNDILDSQGKVKYAEVLLVLNRLVELDQRNIANMKWAEENGYVVTTDKYKSLQQKALWKLLYVKHGLVGIVLDKALECAIEVHKFIETTLTKGGYSKEPKNNWTTLDGKFEAELQKIWVLKEEYTDKMAVAEKMDDHTKKDEIVPGEMDGAKANFNVKH